MKLINKIQKLVMYLFLFSGLAVLITSLFYSTNMQYIKPNIKHFQGEEYNIIKKSHTAIMDANNAIFWSAIVAVIVFAVLLIFANHSRIKFYISNLIAGIAAPVVSIGFAIKSLILNNDAKNAFINNIDLLNQQKSRYESSGKINITVLPMNIATAFTIILIIVGFSLIAYTVVKYVFTRKQNQKVGA